MAGDRAAQQAHIEAPHPLVTRHAVADRVHSHVPHVQVPWRECGSASPARMRMQRRTRGVGEHGQRIVLGPCGACCIARLGQSLSLPLRLPALLHLRTIVRMRARRGGHAARAQAQPRHGARAPGGMARPARSQRLLRCHNSTAEHCVATRCGGGIACAESNAGAAAAEVPSSVRHDQRTSAAHRASLPQHSLRRPGRAAPARPLDPPWRRAMLASRSWCGAASDRSGHPHARAAARRRPGRRDPPHRHQRHGVQSPHAQRESKGRDPYSLPACLSAAH